MQYTFETYVYNFQILIGRFLDNQYKTNKRICEYSSQNKQHILHPQYLTSLQAWDEWQIECKIIL